MAIRNRLIETKKLRTKYLTKFFREKRQIFIHYDAQFDALMLLFDSPMKENIVHYVDKFVGLLYEPKSKEIIGLQIESFKKHFLPKHDEIQRVWKLSESGTARDVGDMILIIEQFKPKLAHEVFKASHELLKHEGIKLNQLIGNAEVNENALFA